jgi:type II secretory pathway pseudopilin PulG
MLRRLLTRLRRNERGFTLIETLVAIVTGVVVTGALFTILEFSVKQSSRLSGVAQATQVSRIAMTRVIEELHSACLSASFTPVIEGSTPSKLIFVNGYDEKESKTSGEPPAELLAGSIHKDVIEFEKANGRLVDKVYKATSNQPIAVNETGYAEKYKFPTTPSLTFRIAEHVSQIETTPIFKYYAYAKTPQGAVSEAASTLEEKESLTKTETAALNAAEAATVASVVVSFRTAPYSREVRLTSSEEKGQFADLTSQATFALGAPNSEATIKAGPCQ